MVEGYFEPSMPLPQNPGRPKNPLSTHLRNLAWIRHLLARLPQIRDWALVGTHRGMIAPDAWRGARREDAAVLRRVLSSENAPRIGRLSDRSPSLLDDVFDELLHGAKSRSGYWFNDKLVSGQRRPDEQRLKRFEDLIPGSAAAFHREPQGMDPWFYGALDYTSVWYGRMHVWRIIDPAFHDPAWQEVLSDDEEPGAFPLRLRRRMHRKTRVTYLDKAAFRSDILLALGHLLFPEQADDPDGFDDLEGQVGAARAASLERPNREHPLKRRVSAMKERAQWRTLTDAIAVLRLERLLVAEDPVGPWWVRGVVDGMRDTLRRRQGAWYWPMPRGTPALEGLLERLIDPKKRAPPSLEGTTPKAKSTTDKLTRAERSKRRP
jgi:hypothetical protein